MTFNAEDFLSQSVSGPMSTSLPVVPEGEYRATIGMEADDVKIELIQGKKDPTKTYPRLTLLWKITGEGVNQDLARDTITVRDQFLLDTNDAGQLDTGEGRNVSLGVRRAALGLNDGPFALSNFRGAGPALIRVTHRSNPNDPSIKYAEVARVVALR
jgi:hypothetical protein